MDEGRRQDVPVCEVRMSAREQSELERAVRIMRDAQKAYFADRRTDDLEAARRAERDVDRILRELDAPQQRLL